MKKLFILLVFVSLSVFAQERSYFEVTPFIHWMTNPISTLSGNASPGFNLAFNLRASNSFSFKPFGEFSEFPLTEEFINGDSKTMTYNKFGVAFRVYL